MKNSKLRILGLLIAVFWMTACNKDIELAQANSIQTEWQRIDKNSTASNREVTNETSNCFNFIYPVTFIFSDGGREKIESVEILDGVIEELESMGLEEEMPTFQFPVSIRLFNGEIHDLQDEKDLEDLLDFCDDEFGEVVLDEEEEERPSKDNLSEGEQFGVFNVQDNKTVIMDGVIDADIIWDWEDLISVYPSISKIIMKDCPGSIDDEVNLVVAKKVREQGVAIHLPTDAAIASGAVDFFLAGTTRTRELGSRIGVHSWSDGKNEATDFPRGHDHHQPYIDYYMELGFSEAAASEFYYFTIHAADAENVHWMSDAEISQYKLLTE